RAKPLPRPRQGAQGLASTDYTHRHGGAPSLVLGHDLSARQRHGALVLPVPDPGPVQPQDRRLGSARHGRLDSCRAPGASHRFGRGHRHARQPAGAAWRQWLNATTVLAMLNWLGVKPSYSRPRVSDDNAYAESLFRTAKYRPEFPTKGFADLDDARSWAAEFVRWYNYEIRHSGIRYVSPDHSHARD